MYVLYQWQTDRRGVGWLVTFKDKIIYRKENYNFVLQILTEWLLLISKHFIPMGHGGGH